MEEFKLLDVVCVSAAILLGGILGHYVRLPKILGYLLVGVGMGPSALGLVNGASLNLLAEVGAGMLLFEAGTEFDLKELRKNWKIFVVGGLIQVGLTLVVAFLVFKAANVGGYRASFMIGMLVSISSTAEAVKLLDTRGEKFTIVGKISIGILVLQDLLVVPYSVMTNLLTGNGNGADHALHALKTFLSLMVAIPVVVIVGRYFLARVYSWALSHNSSEIFRASLVLLMAFAFYLSHEVGLSLALGGFVAGIAISEHRDSHHILDEAGPAKDIFGGLFFVAVGMLVDWRVVADQWTVVVTLVLAIVAIKVVAGAVPLAFMGLPFRVAIGVGLVVAQVGEFSFVLATAGRKSGVLTEEVFKLFVAVSVITMMINPFLLMIRRPLDRLLGDLRFTVTKETGLDAELAHEKPLPETLVGHTVIVGKGAVAKLLVPGLQTLKSRPGDDRLAGEVVIIDVNPANVKKAREEELFGVQGNCGNFTVLERARIHTAGLFVIAAGEMFPKLAAVRIARGLNPGLKIVVRATFKAEVPALIEAGASHVVIDETAAARVIVDYSARVTHISAIVREDLMADAFLEDPHQSKM